MSIVPASSLLETMILRMLFEAPFETKHGMAPEMTDLHRASKYLSAARMKSSQLTKKSGF
jgi:hypothetical protein